MVKDIKTAIRKVCKYGGIVDEFNNYFQVLTNQDDRPKLFNELTNMGYNCEQSKKYGRVLIVNK